MERNKVTACFHFYFNGENSLSYRLCYLKLNSILRSRATLKYTSAEAVFPED